MLDDGAYEGRAAHQAPEVDGSTILTPTPRCTGDIVPATVLTAMGVDLVAEHQEDADTT